MKKIIISIFVAFTVFSCNNNSDLIKMGYAVRQHFKDKDADNNTITTLKMVEPLSYAEVSENERENPDDFYLCKVYVKGEWSYIDSHRIYNIDDTLSCYFTQEKQFIRVAPIKE